MDDYIKWGTPEILVPRNMIFIDENDKIRIKKPLTKKYRVGRTLNPINQAINFEYSKDYNTDKIKIEPNKKFSQEELLSVSQSDFIDLLFKYFVLESYYKFTKIDNKAPTYRMIKERSLEQLKRVLEPYKGLSNKITKNIDDDLNKEGYDGSDVRNIIEDITNEKDDEKEQVKSLYDEYQKLNKKYYNKNPLGFIKQKNKGDTFPTVPQTILVPNRMIITDKKFKDYLKKPLKNNNLASHKKMKSIILEKSNNTEFKIVDEGTKRKLRNEVLRNQK